MHIYKFPAGSKYLYSSTCTLKSNFHEVFDCFNNSLAETVDDVDFHFSFQLV